MLIHVTRRLAVAHGVDKIRLARRTLHEWITPVIRTGGRAEVDERRLDEGPAEQFFGAAARSL